MSTGNVDNKDIFNQNMESDSAGHDAKALGSIFLSLDKMGVDEDDDDYACNDPTPIHSTMTVSASFDPDALIMIEESVRKGNGVFDEVNGNNDEKPNKNDQDRFSEGTHRLHVPNEEAFHSWHTGSFSDMGLPFDTCTPPSRFQIGDQIAKSLSSPPDSPDSCASMLPLSASAQGATASVYNSIMESPMFGRSLDFRNFLTPKQVSPDIEEEGQVGIFVGQLPSTYSEEDTAALLRAIGADAGVDVHVWDVKSHNQSHTCAFVMINRSALQALLDYSKRVLCDASCVWVVESERAPLLRDYIDGLVRDRLRGVPKAALVLEKLTPQGTRRASAAGKKSRPADAVPNVMFSAVPDSGAVAMLHPQGLGMVFPQPMPFAAMPSGPFMGNYHAPIYMQPPAAFSPYGYYVSPVPVPVPVMAPVGPAAAGPHAPPLKGSAGESTAQAQPAAGKRSRKDSAPQPQPQPPSQQMMGMCSSCGKAIALGSMAYVCPRGRTLVCMHCRYITSGLSDDPSTSNIARNNQFVNSVNYANVTQLPHVESSNFCAQPFPGFPQSTSYTLFR